jgi:hypothetical protein
VALVAAYVVPGMIASKLVAAGASACSSLLGPPPAEAEAANELADVGPLIAIYQSSLIVGAAILEGAAFYNAISFLLERQTVNLVAAAVLAAFVISKTPTPARVEDWVVYQLATLRQLRAMRGGDLR